MQTGVKPVASILDNGGPFFGKWEWVEFVSHPEGYKYKNVHEWRYFSRRYAEWVEIEAGMLSNGADFPAYDIESRSWWVHDKLKKEKKWASGRPCSNWQASWVLRDILIWEALQYDKPDRWLRARTWFYATLIWGETLGKIIEWLKGG